ncbi:alpha/beta hydrolase [Corynebacterium atrinae]|uniref:alpha/beta hydrolase n=1 Tax=Corynebacterium atrinae TaxID=1336740 RepID=UPI0025B3F276|nr:alpha/beta hydrolase family protein [Corynebacterium atrinae]
MSLVAAATSAALLLPAVAHAQSSDETVREVATQSSEDPDWSGQKLHQTIETLANLGSSQFNIPGPLKEISPEYPLPVDESIREVRIVNRRIDSLSHRVERWTVASPAMGRNVSVQIQRSANPFVPAPMLYLLDGADAEYNSGWVANGGVPNVLGRENVTVVMPTQARASLYSNWVADDPELGRNQWETFLTEELPRALEADPLLHFNGRRAIGGLSMGAIGALHLANNNPEIYDAAIGISGCYSTTSELGRQTINALVSTRGGILDNLWGPFGSPQWASHDTVDKPDGLRDMAVYLAAANGVIGQEDLKFYAEDPARAIIAGTALERGVLDCTRDLDEAMRERGMTHQVVEYSPTGAHNWRYFNEQLAPAWQTIRPSLY